MLRRYVECALTLIASTADFISQGLLETEFANLSYPGFFCTMAAVADGSDSDVTVHEFGDVENGMRDLLQETKATCCAFPHATWYMHCVMHILQFYLYRGASTCSVCLRHLLRHLALLSVALQQSGSLPLLWVNHHAANNGGTRESWRTRLGLQNLRMAILS